LIFYRMGQRTFVLKNLREVSAVRPSAAGGAAHEMLGSFRAPVSRGAGEATLGFVDPRVVFTKPKEASMADDRVIQIAVSPGTQEFPDEVYLLYQSGALFHGSLSEEGWKWNEVSLPQGKAFHPTSSGR
jgi:hypothetical protein